MRKLKIWLNWFTAKDAGEMSESYSGLQPALVTIATTAASGVQECIVNNLTERDIFKLGKLGCSIKRHSEEWNYGIKSGKYLINW